MPISQYIGMIGQTYIEGVSYSDCTCVAGGKGCAGIPLVLVYSPTASRLQKGHDGNQNTTAVGKANGDRFGHWWAEPGDIIWLSLGPVVSPQSTLPHVSPSVSPPPSMMPFWPFSGPIPKMGKYVGRKAKIAVYDCVCIGYGHSKYSTEERVLFWSNTLYDTNLGSDSHTLISNIRNLLEGFYLGISEVGISKPFGHGQLCCLLTDKDLTWVDTEPVNEPVIIHSLQVGDVVVVRDSSNDKDWNHTKYAGYIAPIREIYNDICSIKGVSGVVFKLDWLEKTEKLPTNSDLAVRILVERGVPERQAYRQIFDTNPYPEEDPMVLFNKAWRVR